MTTLARSAERERFYDGPVSEQLRDRWYAPDPAEQAERRRRNLPAELVGLAEAIAINERTIRALMNRQHVSYGTYAARRTIERFEADIEQMRATMRAIEAELAGKFDSEETIP